MANRDARDRAYERATHIMKSAFPPPTQCKFCEGWASHIGAQSTDQGKTID